MKKLSLIFIALSLFFIACASNEASPDSAPQVTQEKPEVQRASWELKWERTLKEAKRESKVVIIVSGFGSELRTAISEKLMERYGITAEILQFAPGLASQKLLSERRAGLYLCDIFISAGIEIYPLKAAGDLDLVEKLLLLPEVVDPKVWWRGKLDFIDRERLTLSFAATPTIPWAINTELVKTGEEPRGWKDLLQPKWKGKIFMGDPRVAGAPNTVFTVVAYHSPDLGLDYWREFMKQEPVISRDRRLGVEWLAKGKLNLVIGPGSGFIVDFAKAGAPVKNLMPQGKVALSSGSGNLSLLKNAPHPSAAKIYINWLLTREAQTIYSQAMGYQSGRVDVPTSHLEPVQVRQPDGDYIETYHEDFNLSLNEAMKAAQEIFGR